MANEKPTKKEVLKEIVRPVKETGVNIVNSLKKAAKENLALYALPTAFRKEGGESLSGLGMVGYATQGVIYTQLVKNDIPAYWLPISTNVLSALYETGRYIYKKAEKRLTDKNLENKIEEKLKCS